jgi:membrane-bound metal-dependent hydrolase YbcI (DUF457 family)
MLGRQHLMLTASSASMIIGPFALEVPLLALTAFFGACIGALIPDVDARGASIFHESIPGLNGFSGRALNCFVVPVLPFFGFSTKYLIYHPALILLEWFTEHSFPDRHRSFSHSILGVFTMTLMTGLYISIMLLYMQLLNPLFLGTFLLFYMAGAFLHMVQDSCTKTGIQWNRPFSDVKISGRLATGKDFAEARYFTYYLGAISTFTLYSKISTEVSALYLSIVSTGILAFSWLLFADLLSLRKN